MRQSKAIADIGTDHAYLPIELIQRGICKRALACDVRSGPLQRAKQHIQAADLQGRIETRLSNGFAQIEPGEVDAAIIAGMGGLLICEILKAENARPKNILKEMQQLILQPQSDWDAVRYTLHSLSFQIETERLVLDRDKYYWIFVCSQGCQRFEKRWQYRYGQALAHKPTVIFKDYLQQEEEKMRKILARLLQEAEAGSDSAGRRQQELRMRMQEIQEAREYEKQSEGSC
ncbi:MAG: SAM-dependent methyltransferase [Lachnospiraceae bacterium]|nr:SAM-dependent methyltransferase [Lachnospiraceae bacterium]